jgi:hypothetical protein
VIRAAGAGSSPACRRATWHHSWLCRLRRVTLAVPARQTLRSRANGNFWCYGSQLITSRPRLRYAWEPRHYCYTLNAAAAGRIRVTAARVRGTGQGEDGRVHHWLRRADTLPTHFRCPTLPRDVQQRPTKTSISRPEVEVSSQESRPD